MAGAVNLTTWTHQPAEYDCPFCAFMAGRKNTYSNQDFVVYSNAFATAFVAPKWWPNNAGHVLVVPNRHSENLYVISDDDLAEVYKVVKKIAVAIRSSYDCVGTSTRQHNEPAGNQDVWHFHVHVFPRYPNDGLYVNHDKAQIADTSERMAFADKLRAYFAT